LTTGLLAVSANVDPRISVKAAAPEDWPATEVEAGYVGLHVMHLRV
jgi:hypothetical protein